MPSYSCDKCGRVFKQKSGYTDHINKKFDCSQNTVLTTVIEKKVDAKLKEVVRSLTPYPELLLSEDESQRKLQLQAYFEAIHNLLWNRAGLSPEKALEHLTFSFAYRLIEAQADLLGLPQECRWSYLASHKNENDTYETMKKGCVAFQKNKVTKSFFKKPEIDKADVIYEVIQQINRIPLKALQESDTLGDIFEYMLGRGMSTMSDEGQYFTNRTICKLAFKLAFEIKKNLRRADGSLCTFADWFCGTGGFPAEYIKGVKDNLGSVDWKKESNKIYCQDMSLSSVTTTLLNLLILTGIPFTGETIRSANSFADPITKGSSAPFKGLEIDYCFMNPPYGGDKTKGKEYKFTYSKKIKDDTGSTYKKFFVNEDIQTIGIEDDDKVSAGVQLAMATLSKEGGVCAIVLPQGFFFGASKKAIELRKKIAEDYKIWYVVDIASGSFINTGTKTSMLVFQRGVGSTESVKFIGLDEKVLVETKLVDLRSKNYSLNYKQYLAQEDVEVEGFEMVKLGDICYTKNGFAIKSENMTKNKNDYPVAKVKNLLDGVGKIIEDNDYINIKLSDEFIVKNGDILIVMVGNTAGKMAIWKDKDVFRNQNVHKLYFNDKALGAYVFYLLNSQYYKEQLTSLSSGTAQPFITPSAFYQIQIPLPSIERQQEIVAAIDVWNDFARMEGEMLSMLEKQMMFYVKEMGKERERVKLEKVLKSVKGKRYPVGEGKDSGKYPLLRSSKDGKVKWMDDYTYEGPYITVGNGGEANFRLIEKFNASTHTLVYDVNEGILKEFVYYSIQSNRDMISEMCFQGTGLENLNTNLFMEIEIPLPPLAEQQTLQSDFDEIKHKHAKIAEYKAKAQEAIMRLIPGA